MQKRCMILLLLMALLCTGCGQSTTTETTAGNTTSAETTAETETEATWQTTLPDTDMGGWVCKVLTIQNESYAVNTRFKPEELTGEIVNDALYSRNQKIGEKFNMSFAEDGLPNFWETTDAMKLYVLAGSDDYQLNMLIQRDAFSLSLDNMLAPVDMLPYVQPDKPWYVQAVNDAMTLGDRQYILYSAECLNLYEQTCLVLYNKQIWDTVCSTDAYSMVRDGTWTYDVFMTNAEAAIIDLDGDGDVSDNDQLGIVSEHDFFYPTLELGAGFTMIEMVDGQPTFTVGQNEPLIGLLQDMLRTRTVDGLYFDSFMDRGEAFSQYGADEKSRVTSRQIFESGAAAFYVAGVSNIQHIREMEDDFGILPAPKYTEDQDGYHSRIIDGWLDVVPSTNLELENTSLLLEALAEESYRSVLPAYMEVALKDKYTRDPDSAEMLDLVFSTTTLDLGDTVWQGDVRCVYNNVLLSGKDSFSSTSASVQKKIEKTIADALEKLAKLG